MLANVLSAARQGRSGVLVIRGEAGIGKTALLADAVASTTDISILQMGGAESELELAYAGVQQLCSPLLMFIDRLPEPQSKALHVALGLTDGAAPDRLLVGLAVLTLLAEASSERPVLCIIDDAQWIDSASRQALALVARRILAEPLVMIFAVREPGTAVSELAGQPELILDGLDDHDARTLLATMVPGRLNERVVENLIAEAGGNPLALLELHKAVTPAEIAGGYRLANAASPATRIERAFGRRFSELPSDTKTLLLIAAAEPAGRAEWLWASAARLGIDVGAATPAESAGLIAVDRGIRFRHPLIRTAIYRNASRAERGRVHAALALAITGPAADDYRAWHRAHAATAPMNRSPTNWSGPPSARMRAEASRPRPLSSHTPPSSALIRTAGRSVRSTPPKPNWTRAPLRRPPGCSPPPARPLMTNSSPRARSCCAPRWSSWSTETETHRRCSWRPQDEWHHLMRRWPVRLISTP